MNQRRNPGRIGAGLGTALLVAHLACAACAAEVRCDRYGDPLPEHALARFGTVRFLPQAEVWAIAIAPDGKTVATGTIPGTMSDTVELWDASTGKKVGALVEGTNNILSLAWSPDARKLAIAHDYRVELFEVGSRKSLGLMEQLSERPKARQGSLRKATNDPPPNASKVKSSYWSLGWSPDGRYLVAHTHAFETVVLWDTATRKLLRAESPGPELLNVAFSPDGRSLAVCGLGFLELWDMPHMETRVAMKAGENAVCTVAFSPDGKTLAVGTELPHPVGTAWEDFRARVRFWDAATGEPRGETTAFPGNWAAVAYSGDGRTVISGAWAWRDSVQFWDAVTHQQRARVFRPGCLGRGLSVSADGRTLATAGRRIALWDVAACKPRHSWEGHSATVLSAEFTPDGNILSASTRDGLFHWDTKSGRVLRRLGDPETGVATIALAPNARLLAGGLTNGKIALWEWPSGKLLGTLPGHAEKGASGFVNCLAFAPDGNSLVSCGRDCAIRFWNVAQRRQLRELKLAEQVWRVKFSPDGKAVAIGTINDDIRLLDPAHQGQVARIARSACFLGPFDFVGGGDLMAVPQSIKVPIGQELRTAVQLWDLRQQRQVWASKPLPLLYVIASSHDGRLLATATADHNDPIHVWSVKTGRLVAEFSGQGDLKRALTFSADDSQLLSASQDGTLILWQLPAKGPEE